MQGVVDCISIMNATFSQKRELSLSIVMNFFEDEKYVWNMVIERTAEEADLEENHYLEQIGDTIWQTVTEIYCCPFCGESLSTSKEQVNSANMVLYENWHSWYGSRL